MTVGQFAKATGFDEVCISSPEKEIDGAYVGDLLSWVMGNASSGNVWITIMSNSNVLAVATLADVSCILLAEGVRLDDEIIDTARSKDINILSTPLSAYDAAVITSKVIS